MKVKNDCFSPFVPRAPSIEGKNSLEGRRASIRHRMPPLAIEQDTEPAVKVYSWDEIRKHDKEGDAWVVKGGQVTLHRKGA